MSAFGGSRYGRGLLNIGIVPILTFLEPRSVV